MKVFYLLCVLATVIVCQAAPSSLEHHSSVESPIKIYHDRLLQYPNNKHGRRFGYVPAYGAAGLGAGLGAGVAGGLNGGISAGIDAGINAGIGAYGGLGGYVPGYTYYG